MDMPASPIPSVASTLYVSRGVAPIPKQAAEFLLDPISSQRIRRDAIQETTCAGAEVEPIWTQKRSLPGTEQSGIACFPSYADGVTALDPITCLYPTE